jgi:hypothetical protein
LSAKGATMRDTKLDTILDVYSSYRKVSDNNHQGEKDNKEGNTVCSDTGKVFRVKVETLDKKYAGCTKTCNVRLLCIPKVVPHIEEKPPTPILKKTCRINYIKRKAEINDIIYKEEWKEDLGNKNNVTVTICYLVSNGNDVTVTVSGNDVHLWI